MGRVSEIKQCNDRISKMISNPKCDSETAKNLNMTALVTVLQDISYSLAIIVDKLDK